MDIKETKNRYSARKISKDLIDKILSDIKSKSSNKHAAESNGISERVLYYWIQQGTLDMDCDKDNLYTFLVQSLRKIEQNEIIECRKKILSNKKSHKGAEWTLEKVHWKIYSQAAQNIELNERLENLELDKLKKSLTDDYLEASNGKEKK